MQIRDANEGNGCSTSGHDDLHPFGTVAEGADHVLHIQQAQVEDWIQLIQNHDGVQRTGDGAFGNDPAALGLLTVKARGLLRGEVIGAAGAQMVDQVGKTLLQGLDGRVFVVGTAGSFQKPEQQHPGAALFTDAQADRAQNNTEGSLAFAFALTVIDVQLSVTALTAVGRGDDANVSRHGPGFYRWSLPRPTGVFRHVPAAGTSFLSRGRTSGGVAGVDQPALLGVCGLFRGR